MWNLFVVSDELQHVQHNIKPAIALLGGFCLLFIFCASGCMRHTHIFNLNVNKYMK